jgi:hypothetical protein
MTNCNDVKPKNVASQISEMKRNCYSMLNSIESIHCLICDSFHLKLLYFFISERNVLNAYYVFTSIVLLLLLILLFLFLFSLLLLLLLLPVMTRMTTEKPTRIIFSASIVSFENKKNILSAKF